MSALTSIDYARLIQFIATKMYHTLLNKTQVNKILFYVYGAYLAEKSKRLFDDDSPRVWTYGPVFPKPNKKVISCEKIGQGSFTQEQIATFKSDSNFLSRIVRIVGNMCDKSAYSLSSWSHEEGSPWYETLYIKDSDGKITSQNPWNTLISDDVIKRYFENSQNLIFG
jgi:uncharacterized phage-associated protein